MKHYTIEKSENGWEYTGYINIHCNDSVKKIGDNVILIDGNITIEFDEEVNIRNEYIKDI